MTVSAKDIAVLESPKTLVVGETRAYAMDFSDVGTPSAANDTLCYDETGAAQAGLVTGSTTLAGAVATSKLFTPTSEGMYLILVSVTISGQTKYGAVYVAVSEKVHARTTIGSSSYGSVNEIATLVPRYANKAGKFDDGTQPRYNDVVTLVNQVSSILNAQLAQHGFTVPVSDTDVKPMLDLFVNEEVAAIAEGINGMGRFSPRAKYGGGSRFRLVFRDVAEFLEANAIGMAAMGAARPDSNAAGIGYRDTDEAGDATFPLFQRKGYGDDEFQEDWDA